MLHFIVSYNNAFRILHNLHMRCSASFMFTNAIVDSCSTCIRNKYFQFNEPVERVHKWNCAEYILLAVTCIPLLNCTKYKIMVKVEHRDSKCDFFEKSKNFFLHRLILWNVFFKMTHVLPLISAQNCDKNALQNRSGRPVHNKFGSLTIVFSVLSFGQNPPMYSIFAAQYLHKY